MSWHEVWHVLVLASTLVAAASAAILLLAPVVFEAYPESLRRARALVIALIVLGLAGLVVEWRIVHG